MAASLSPTSDTSTATESLSHLLVQICSVRLPSSSKLVDIGVIMKIDDKYTYRTEIIRKKNRTSPLINIDESFDVLVSLNSVIHFKILAPTRIFGRNDLAQLEFNLRSVIDHYYLNQSHEDDDSSPSYRIQLAFQNSATIINPFRLNDAGTSSNGMIEVIFNGSILKKYSHEICAQSVS